MSSMETELDTDLAAADLSQLCRGCLTSSGEMRNMMEWGLVDDFYRLTNIQVDTVDNPSLQLCAKCEDVIYKWRSFKAACQASDAILKSAILKRQDKYQLESTINSAMETSENTIFTELTNNSVVMKIIAPNMDTKIQLPCHRCHQNFLKRTDLSQHLIKHHKVDKDFTVDLKYHCHLQDCNYYVNSCTDKYFVSRKYLNQHIFKVHGDKIPCNECGLTFFNDLDYKRHLKTCNCMFACQICGAQFNMREKSMVHMKRKHPEVHAQYKNEKKLRKRSSDTSFHAKMVKKVKKDTKDKNGSDEKEGFEGSLNTMKASSENSLDAKMVDDKTERNTKDRTNFDKNIRVKKLELLCDSPNKTLMVENERFNKLDFNGSPNAIKTSSEIGLDLRKVATNARNRTDFDKNTGFDKLEFLCDSPKRSFATQTLELERHIKNDVTLPSWQAERPDETKKDEIATQTVFEDLLSLKSNISEEETIFSDSVSLSDIQTQTFPFEFGLSRSNKETLTDQSDLSFKETQTCVCLYDSPKANFRCPESISSSPSTFSVLTSTETQTLDFDLLGFTSAETQTSFDEELQKQL